MKKVSAIKRFTIFIRNICIFLCLSSIAAVIAFRFLPVPFTPLMLKNSAENLFSGKSPVFKHEWVSIENISPHLCTAVVASEDQLFYEHSGFDFKQIKIAIAERQSGKRYRGASTISQQTAKNVFTFCSSTWLRKGVETYFTLLIECLWSKERILEVYLNSIEMADGIYGAEAIANENFNCSAKELTRKQCALIAATLPNPKQYSSKKPSRYMLKRQKQILREMKAVAPRMEKQ